MSSDKSHYWDDFPNQVLSIGARVLVVKDFLQCGLALLEGAQPALCFFRSAHIIQPRGDIGVVSKWLPDGTQIQVNAKKESNSKPVAYIATSVWFQGEDLGHVHASRNFLPTSHEDRDTYNRFADDLTWDIKTSDKQLLQTGGRSSASRDQRRSSDDRDRRSNSRHRSPARRDGRDHDPARSSRDRDQYHDRGRDQAWDRNQYQERDRNQYEDHRYRDRDQYQGRDRDQYQGRDWNRDQYQDRYRDHEHHQGRDRDLSRDHHQDRGRERDQDRDYRSRDHNRKESDGDWSRRNSGYPNDGQNSDWTRDRSHDHRQSKQRDHRDRDDRSDRPGSRNSRRGSREHESSDRSDRDRQKRHKDRNGRRTPGGSGRNTPLEPIPEVNNSVTEPAFDTPADSGRATPVEAPSSGAHTPPEDPASPAAEDTGPMEADESQDTTSRKRERTPSPTLTEAPAPKKKKRYTSPDRVNDGPEVVGVYHVLPPHTQWRAEGVELLSPDSFKEIPVGEEGHAVTLESWVDSETGILACPRNSHRIFFDIGQMWDLINRSEWTQMKEMYSSSEVRSKFPAGTRLRCFYRKWDLGQHQFQATVIWREGYAPKSFRTAEYLAELQRIASNVRDNKNVTSSLFSRVRDGVVHEYISHETGLIRLLDEDMGVAHFSLEQVWVGRKNGKGNYLLKSNLHKSLQFYLPLGTSVKVLVRTIPHERGSQLMYQASLAWRSEFGSATPTEFSSLTASRQSRLEISRQLDYIHDRFKQNAQLSILAPSKMYEPVLVPVILNLLPKDGQAVILGQLSSENKHIGLIDVTLTDISDPATKIKLFALFEIEDLYNSEGKAIFQSGSPPQISELKDVEVDLIARSISSADSYSGLKALTLKLKNSTEFKDIKVPLLQAVSVFIKPPSGKLISGASPLPTFFRREPMSLNKKQFGTAYFFNLSLRHRLDLKVYEYIDGCSNVHINAAKQFLHGRFFDQKLTISNRKNGPRAAIKRLGSVDVHSDIRHNFGSLNPELLEVPTFSLPVALHEADATVKLLWLERPNPKYGLVRVNIEGRTALAFFSTNAINTRRCVSDVSKLFWKNMKYVRVNADLMDSSSKVPYVVTEMWLIGDKLSSWAQPKHLKDEWKKVVNLLLGDSHSLNIRAFCADEKAEQDQMEQLEKSIKNFSQPVKQQQQAEEDLVPRSGKLSWRSYLKSSIGKVEKIINANYAYVSGYQDLPGIGEKRYFVLFDLCDVFINNDLAIKSVKSLKDAMAEGDTVRLNAVYIDVDNSWNLNYIATAVLACKKAVPPDLPAQAPLVEDAKNLKVEKVSNFKIVMTKITKKAPPEDKRPPQPPQIRRPNDSAAHSQSPAAQGRRYGDRPSTNHHSYQAQKAANQQRQLEERRLMELTTRKNAAKRRELMESKPEVFSILKSMEINRGGTFLYDCKTCGIQGMSIDDAEDHISTESHMEKNTSTGEAQGVAEPKRFQDRSEAEEALFLNANKGISVEEKGGRKFYACADCKAVRMPFLSAKKHVLSQAHRRRDKSKGDSAALDQECKEMRKVARVGIVYFCQPCAFQTESIIQNKEHILEASHKRLTTLFCHVCKEFMRDRSALSDHRFSILHKKNLTQLEADCSKPVQRTKKPPPPAAASEATTSSSNGGRAVEEEKEEDNLNCTFCNFTGKDRTDYREHEETSSHKRRYFIQTGKMPSGGADALLFTGERCTTIEEMVLVREGKDIEERGRREKSLRESQELKEQQESLLNKVFDAGVFTQMEKKTCVRCNTCRTLLNGKEKQLTRQLLAHLVGDKHRGKLRVQIKAEENTGVDRNTAQREEEEAEREAEAARPPSPAAAEPEPVPNPMPSAQASCEEKLAWLTTQREVLCAHSDKLCYCLDCKTGLKPVDEMMKHLSSKAHEAKLTEAREWRLYIDLIDILEHGDHFFKCLPCNTQYMRKSILELHLSNIEHMQRFVDEEKDKVIEAAIPAKYEICSDCKEYFATELDHKIHMKAVHKKDCDLSQDQIENLKTLSQSRNLTSGSVLDRSRGRVLQILPSAEFGILQIPVADDDCQYHNVLFDLSRLQIEPKEGHQLVDLVRPGCPVLVNAVEMEPVLPGYSENITYYASAVTVGDEDEHNSMPVTFGSLKSEVGPTFSAGMRLSKAALLVELDLCAKGRLTPLFHNLPDHIEFGTGIVVMKNQSVMLVKLQKDHCFALQILESVMLTDSGMEVSEETFEVGDSLHLNALLLDPGQPTQYLITGCWSTTPRPSVDRTTLKRTAVDMYHNLSSSYCWEPSAFSIMDLSNVLVPTAGGIGFDDIAAGDDDLAAGDSLAAGLDDLTAESSLVEEDNISAGQLNDHATVETEEGDSSGSQPFVGIKIASFAKKSQ